MAAYQNRIIPNSQVQRTVSLDDVTVFSCHGKLKSHSDEKDILKSKFEKEQAKSWRYHSMKSNSSHDISQRLYPVARRRSLSPLPKCKKLLKKVISNNRNNTRAMEKNKNKSEIKEEIRCSLPRSQVHRSFSLEDISAFSSDKTHNALLIPSSSSPLYERKRLSPLPKLKKLLSKAVSKDGSKKLRMEESDCGLPISHVPRSTSVDDSATTVSNETSKLKLSPSSSSLLPERKRLSPLPKLKKLLAKASSNDGTKKLKVETRCELPRSQVRKSFSVNDIASFSLKDASTMKKKVIWIESMV